MELQIYYYKNLLSLKIRPFYENFIVRKFGAIRYIAYHDYILPITIIAHQIYHNMIIITNM